MMLEYTLSLEDALADDTNVTWLATELEKTGFITEDQRKSLETSVDADIRAAELISMVKTEVRYSSEKFITFLDVLKKDEATFGHILAKVKDKVPSGTPGELHVRHSHPTSAQLSWTPVPEDKQNNTITGYTVQVVRPNSTQEIPVMDGNATSYEVSDLRPNTTYTFGVSATTKGGTGPPIIVFSTTPQRPPSGTPKWLTVRGSLPTSVWLSWGSVPEDQQNGEITGYSIQVEGPDNTWRTTTVSDRMHRPHSIAYTSEELSDLRPSAEYTFSVSAKTVVGSGPAISVSFVTPQEALSNIIGSFKTSQYHPISAQISWEAVKEYHKTVTGYTVRVEGPDSTQLIPINYDITTFKIIDLRPSTQYTFKVSAVTEAGTKPQRDPFNTHPRLWSRYGQSTYSWKSFFMATSGKSTAQYRMILESTPSLKDALADDTNVTWLATELEKTGLITEDQRKSLETSIDTDTSAAKLISMITSKICSNSENFTTFCDVLKKDEATYGHVLAKIKDKVPSGTPGELFVSHSLSTSTQLSWAPVPEDKQNDTIIGYTVQVEGPDSTREIPVMDGNTTSYEVSDLTPCTTYTFSVSAMTEAGTGPPIIVSSTIPLTEPSLKLSPYSQELGKRRQRKTVKSTLSMSSVLVNYPQLRRRLLVIPAASSPAPSLEPLEQLSSYSQEPVKHKAGKSRADYPRLGLRPLLSSPYPSPKPGSNPQELIEHKAEQSIGDASLSMVLPKGYIKLRDLNVIKWNFKDESGKAQQLTLIKKIAHKWRTIGMLLGLTYFKLRCLDDKYSHGFISRQEECCREVLKLWLDNPPPKYPATWQGLIKLLEDSQLEEVATELTNILTKL